jgi:hypothetical protein
MSQFNFSALSNNQHLIFDCSVDILNFDSLAMSASAVNVTQVDSNLSFTFGTKTVWLDNVLLQNLVTGTTSSIAFANGSKMGFGDFTASPIHDWEGVHYSLETVTDAVQVWGLGGADHVATGSGDDLLVGNVAIEQINHVSQGGVVSDKATSDYASISADGNFVAFVNYSDGLVKNITTDAVSRLSLSGSGSPRISADGNKVVFSGLSNLVGGSSSHALYDLYMSDVHGSGIIRVSTGTGGTLAADGRNQNADISYDGQYVVFESATTNWAAGGSTSQYDIFLKDTVNGNLTRLSTSLTGSDGNGDSQNAKISADGRYVVFQSAATDLVAGDTNGYSDIFVWDRNSGLLTNLTKDLTAVSNPNNGSFNPDVASSAIDGGIVVFESGKNLLAADTHNSTDIYAYHLATGALQLVSCDANGVGVGVSSTSASVSGDGRFVVFTGGSDGLVPGDNNGVRDVFVKDLFTGEIALVSKSAAGVAGNMASTSAQISLGGEWIVFGSSASTLASTDATTDADIFRVSNPLLKDTLEGGTGNDTYVLSRNDVVVEGLNAGIDTVKASMNYKLGDNLENLTLTGTADINGIGNALNNIITGNVGNNWIDGGSGTDTVICSGTKNQYTISGSNGSYTVSGLSGTVDGSDTLTGVERLQFLDTNFVLDLYSDSHAIQSMEFIGTIAPSLLNDKSIRGVIIAMFDQGYTMEQMSGLALQYNLVPHSTNIELANAVYQNVLHELPSTDMANALVGYINANGQANFLATVAGLHINVDLVGLAQTGIEFV